MTTTRRLLISFAFATTSLAGCTGESPKDSSGSQPAQSVEHGPPDARQPAGEFRGDGGEDHRKRPVDAGDAGASMTPEPPPQCGRWGQVCCGIPGDGVCDINNVCLQFDNWCSPRFTTPCTSTSQCGAGLVCEFNYCLSCGVTGYECCADNSCNTPGATCNAARKCQVP